MQKNDCKNPYKYAISIPDALLPIKKFEEIEFVEKGLQIHSDTKNGMRLTICQVSFRM